MAVTIFDFETEIESLKELGFLETVNSGGFLRMVHEYLELADLYVTFLPQDGRLFIQVDKSTQIAGGSPNIEEIVLEFAPFQTGEELILLLKSTNISMFDELW